MRTWEGGGRSQPALDDRIPYRHASPDVERHIQKIWVAEIGSKPQRLSDRMQIGWRVVPHDAAIEWLEDGESA
jgi:hypothetical protein